LRSTAAALLAITATSRAAAGCDEIRPAELDFSLRVDPPEPEVGDAVVVEARIDSGSGALAEIPLFQLLGAEPWFAIEEQENSYPYVDFVRYRLRAVRAGQAVLQVSVNFETACGCRAAPLVSFRTATSLPYPIAVRGDATASPTPTPRPPTRTVALTPARISAASPRR
jgi:hypothetical protein